jgi:cell fate (sporulation/competence/biofilm development) regulator YlbF (YheA/YmcA/DUF963 family)
MNTPLTAINELNEIIRELHKIDSKFHAGQFLALYRENRRIIASLEQKKSKFIKSNDNASSKDIENMDEISYLIRQLVKIDSRLHAGQFIDACGDNQKIIAYLEKKKQDIISEHNGDENE